MRNKDKNVLVGILCAFSLLFVGATAVAANASEKNNLLTETAMKSIPAPKGAFLVSKPKSKVILAKYENIAHQLTDKQLVEMLRAVGFTGKGLRTAWAVAKSESNGRPLAFNGNLKTGDNSYGVFQINMLGDLGPERRDKFDLATNAELFSPVTNAQIVYIMTQGGTNWKAWKYAKSPAVKKWLKKFPTSF